MASKVDWLLSGPAQSTVTSNIPNIVSMLMRTSSQEPVLVEGVSEQDPNLSVFWELEHIGIKETHMGRDPMPLYTRFDHQIVQQRGGRYRVPLPWNSNKTRLQPNKALAEGSLRSLLRRLYGNQSLFQEYHRQMQDFILVGLLKFLLRTPPTETSSHIQLCASTKKLTKFGLSSTLQSRGEES